MGFKKVADGTFSENFSKEGQQPDYTGKVVWEGTRYNLAVWKRENSETGEPFYSFAVSKPEGPPAEPRQPKPKPDPYDALEGGITDLEDDIPF